MNRYATNKFDFIRGWKNAAGRTLAEVSPAVMPSSNTTVVTRPISTSPALVADPVISSIVRPTSTNVSTPVNNTPSSQANTSSNLDVSVGGGGGGGGSSEKEKVAAGDSKTNKDTASLSVKDKVSTFLFLSMMVTGLYLVGTNLKLDKASK